MKRDAAEPRRRIDFSRARRGAVVKPQPGKTKISIRLDNEVLDHFRGLVDAWGGGNYQSLINDALRTFIRQESVVDVTRDVVKHKLETTLRRVLREEAAAYNVEERTRTRASLCARLAELTLPETPGGRDDDVPDQQGS
jgi:uncharacterized protein (DUF4415 family)